MAENFARQKFALKRKRDNSRIRAGKNFSIHQLKKKNRGLRTGRTLVKPGKGIKRSRRPLVKPGKGIKKDKDGYEILDDYFSESELQNSIKDTDDGRIVQSQSTPVSHRTTRNSSSYRSVASSITSKGTKDGDELDIDRESQYSEADRAKAIKTTATVNERPTYKLIRELPEENARLMDMIKTGGMTVPVGVGGGSEGYSADETLQKSSHDSSNSSSQNSKDITKNSDECLQKSDIYRAAPDSDENNLSISKDSTKTRRQKNSDKLGRIGGSIIVTSADVHVSDMESGQSVVLSAELHVPDIEPVLSEKTETQIRNVQSLNEGEIFNSKENRHQGIDKTNDTAQVLQFEKPEETQTVVTNLVAYKSRHTMGASKIHGISQLSQAANIGIGGNVTGSLTEVDKDTVGLTPSFRTRKRLYYSVAALDTSQPVKKTKRQSAPQLSRSPKTLKKAFEKKESVKVQEGEVKEVNKKKSKKAAGKKKKGGKKKIGTKNEPTNISPSHEEDIDYIQTEMDNQELPVDDIVNEENAPLQDDNETHDTNQEPEMMENNMELQERNHGDEENIEDITPADNIIGETVAKRKKKDNKKKNAEKGKKKKRKNDNTKEAPPPKKTKKDKESEITTADEHVDDIKKSNPRVSKKRLKSTRKKKSPLEPSKADMKKMLEYIEAKWFDESLKSQASTLITEYYSVSSHPYALVIYFIENCRDHNTGTTTLCFHLMKEFLAWLKNAYIVNQEKLLTEDIKLRGLQACTRYSIALFDMAVKAFKLYTTKNDYMLPEVQKFLEKKKYNEAAVIASKLGLQGHFTAEEIALPLVLQDKINVLETFAIGNQQQQTMIVQMLDNLCDKATDIDDVISKSSVPKPKREKFTKKTLSKLATRLRKLYDVPQELCPTLNQEKKLGALKFLLHRSYIEDRIGAGSWEELVQYTVGDSDYLKEQLIEQLMGYNDLIEAVKWAKYYQLSDGNIPEVVAIKRRTMEQNKQKVDVRKSWDANFYSKAKISAYYYTLDLPQDHISLIDTRDKYKSCLSTLSKPGMVIGVNSEKRPPLGSEVKKIALIQMATYDHAYLIDIKTLQQQLTEDDWQLMVFSIFCNPDVVKLGYGINVNFKMFIKTFPFMEKTLAKIQRVVDLKKIAQQFTGFKEQGMGQLVHQYFGKTLNKSEWWSDWERRPLRQPQIVYAGEDRVPVMTSLQSSPDIHQLTQTLHMEASKLNIKKTYSLYPGWT